MEGLRPGWLRLERTFHLFFPDLLAEDMEKEEKGFEDRENRAGQEGTKQVEMRLLPSGGALAQPAQGPGLNPPTLGREKKKKPDGKQG